MRGFVWSLIVSLQNSAHKNKNACDNVIPMGDPSLTSHFILKATETQGPFPSISLLSSFFLTKLHHVPYFSFLGNQTS